MKKIIYLLIVTISVMSSCKESPYMFFDSENRVQMQSNDNIRYSFYYEPKDVTESVVYLNIRAVGLQKNTTQKISIEQVSEFYTEYLYDERGIKTDSIIHEYKNKGISGVHYIALDDPRVADNLFVPANTYIVKIPITVKRDISLKNGDVRICFRLKETDDLLLCQENYLQQTIILSDRLIRPSLWPEYLFADYSTVKHEFMIKVAKEKIDDEWLEKIINKGTGIDKYWINKFTTALNEFNEDPENIKNGTAPLREDPTNPESKLISFIY